MDKSQSKHTIDEILLHIAEIKKQYASSNAIEELTRNLHNFAAEYHSYVGVGDYLLNLGEEFISSGNYQAGIVYIKTVDQYFLHVANTTLLNLRMAESYIENKETERGIEHLIKLCTSVSNYEESIAFQGLTEIWEKMRHFVEGMVPPSSRIHRVAPKVPGECTMQINDILSMPDSDILSALSEHLGELSGNGDSLNWLNKWERVFYYADEICMEVNSGGFESYLYYNGTHFAKAYQAFVQIGAEQMVQLMDRIQSKFPRGRVPKSEEAIQNSIDRLDDEGIDFEAEDEAYYTSAEKELLDRLYAYVLKNRNHFR